MEVQDKNKLIVIGIIFLIIIVFNIYRNTIPHQFKRYILNRGFVLEEDKTFYYKQISDTTIKQYKEDKANNINSTYDYLYLDLYTNKLSEEINEYKDNYETSLNINYKFSTKKTDFIYRINYNNSMNAMFKGEYDEENNNYYCKKEFAQNIDLSSNTDDFCEYASYYVESFEKLRNTIFRSDKMVKYLERK